MRIEIICTGDEVLTGKIVNTGFGRVAANSSPRIPWSGWSAAIISRSFILSP